MLARIIYLIRFIILICIFCTPLQLAAQNEELTLPEIIDTTDYLPDYYDGSESYNLMIAASKGYDSEVIRLISAGADINVETNEGATALIFAVANNHLTTVKTILEFGPDPDKRTSADETPVLISAKNGNLEITEVLIRAGADINSADKYGATPLHYASIYGNFFLTDLLLYYEADCNKKSRDGTTPLMAAIWAGQAETADLLIQNGANLEARDNEGFTPFLLASQNGDTLLMRVLLNEGIDLYEKTNHKFDALDLAISSDRKPAAEFLLEKGDKWAAANREDINPYQVATAYGRKELIELLEEKNIRGSSKARIDELAINASVKFNNHDVFTGLNIKLKEPLINGGFTFGCDLKPWYTRVLMKNEEDVYYQYMDKSAIVYGGIFKDFVLSEKLAGQKFLFSVSFDAAYNFGNKLKGTRITPDEKLRINPSAGLKLQIRHIQAFTFLEYMKTPFYKVGPLWLRTGCSYTFYFSRVRSPGKIIKWF